MADNPVSWFLLTIALFYFGIRFLRQVYLEAKERRLERERYIDNEIFLEKELDRKNIMAYNKKYGENFGRKKL